MDNYKIVWFLHDFPRNKRKGIVCVNGNNIKNIRSYYYLRRCKYFLYDHNNLMNFVKKREEQIVFGFTHGATFKGGKKWNNSVSNASTFSPFWFKYLARFEGCDVSQMVDLGYPRNDWLFSKETNELRTFKKKYEFDKYNKIILWMPTFRKSHNKTISEEYFDSATGLPILKDEKQLTKLDELLRKYKMLCIFKIHHLQASLDVYRSKFTNILVLHDEEIIDNGLQLYQIVQYTDILITDYSSIFVDYMLLNRPIIFTLDDYEEYKNSRGFMCDNVKDYLLGYHVYNETELFEAIKDVVTNNDRYALNRNELKGLFFTYPDGNSTERILKFLKLG